MKFGLCTAVNSPVLSLMKEAGFDYAEGVVASVLKPAESQDAFEDGWNEIRAMALPVEAVNCFIPEPSSALLALSGVALLLRRQRKNVTHPVP